MTITTRIAGNDLEGFRWRLHEGSNEIANSSTCDDRMAYSSAVECARGAQRNLERIQAERRTTEAAPALLAALCAIVKHANPPDPMKHGPGPEFSASLADFNAAMEKTNAAFAIIDPDAYQDRPAAIPTERLGTLATIQRHARMAGALHQLVDDARAHDSALDAEPHPQSPTGDDYNEIMAMIEVAASVAGLERA